MFLSLSKLLALFIFAYFFIGLNQARSQDKIVNITHNGDLEIMTKPNTCPGWLALAFGAQSHIDYGNKTPYGQHIISGWFGTHSEFIMNKEILPNHCSGELTFPDNIPGTGHYPHLVNQRSLTPPQPNTKTNNIFFRTFNDFNQKKYRTEYLRGELETPLYKGIRYETSFDFALNASTSTHIGLRKLGVLFYNENQAVPDDQKEHQNYHNPGSIQLPYNYAIPPINTSIDSAPIDWNSEGMFQNNWSLTNDVAYWKSRKAGLHILEKEKEIASDGSLIHRPWGDPKIEGYNKTEGDFKLKLNWETVKNNNPQNKYYIPESEGQKTFVAGVFYEDRIYENYSNIDLGYNNPSLSLNETDGLTARTSIGASPTTTFSDGSTYTLDRAKAGSHFSFSAYYDNFKTYCQSEPMFKVLSSSEQQDDPQEFFRRQAGKEIQLKCGDDLNFQAIYKKQKPEIENEVANYKHYRWTVNGLSVRETKRYNPIELSYAEISSLYSQAPVQSFFDLIPPARDQFWDGQWGEKEFYLGMETTCLPTEFDAWTEMKDEEKVQVNVIAPIEGDLNIIIKDKNNNKLNPSVYPIKINPKSNDYLNYGLDISLTGHEGFNQVELHWSLFKINHSENKKVNLIDRVKDNENLFKLFLGDEYENKKKLSVGDYEVVAHLKIGKNCYQKDISTTIKVRNQGPKLEDFQIYAPTAFSPDGKGENETFRFYPNSNIASMYIIKSFNIFHRQGGLVHQISSGSSTDTQILLSQNSKYEWDGRIMGRDHAAQGVYVYTLTIQIGGEVYNFGGDLFLKR